MNELTSSAGEAEARLNKLQAAAGEVQAQLTARQNALSELEFASGAGATGGRGSGRQGARAGNPGDRSPRSR